MDNLSNKILQSDIIKIKDKLPEIFTKRKINDSSTQDSFAFLAYSLSKYFDEPIDDVIEYITEGSHDNNIDACCIKDDAGEDIEVHIFQSKYKSLDNLNKTITTNEIRLFLDSVKKIFIDNDSNNLTVNTYLKDVISTYNEVLKGENISSIKLYINSYRDKYIK
ncbi:MAG: hypothetical protein LBH40_05385 [Alphaproteobacteria bacterium]|jgi:hypothetical protein|nr:hypothetical protein [Alphaproteobacteria bacterium]